MVLPILPADLCQRLTAGRLILFVGAGLSRPDFPSWPGMIERIFEQAESLGIDTADSRRLAAQNKLDRAAGALRRSLGPTDLSVMM